MARKLRIAVGSPAALYSAVWTIWTQGDELYAAASSMRGIAKLSVHSSGVCRYAFAERVGAEPLWDKDPRVMARWNIAGVGHEDWTQCFTLVVPSTYLPRRFGESALRPARRASVVWVPAAEVGHSTVVMLFRARSDTQDISEISDFTHGDYQVLGRMSLRSGGVVWAMSYEQEMPKSDLALWQSELAKAKFDTNVEFADDTEAFTTMLSANSKFPSPMIRDVALGPGNFTVEGKPI